MSRNGSNHPAEDRDQRDADRRASAAQDCSTSLLQRPGALAQLRQPLLFEPPATTECAGNLAQHEPVDAFAHARADAVFRRRDVHMMAAVVLDTEVAVAHQAVDDLRGSPVGAARLVTELMADQDRIGAREARAQRQRQIRPPGQRAYR